MTGAGAAPGLLPVDKPRGPTSHDIVDRVRKALKIKRVGHTGTLDPFASGLLLLLTGRATRLAEYLHLPRKAYQATARLGSSTTTDDLEGEPLSEDSSEEWRAVDVGDVEAALEGFQGRILQTPPVYSAKKVAGEAAHRRARRGEGPALDPVEVEVHEVALEAFEPPLIRFSVVCSTGTYIRSLARDLGQALGTAAHLVELRRTSVGPFQVDEALAPEALSDPEAVRAALLPPERALDHLATVRLGGEGSARFVHGGAVGVADEGVRLENLDGAADVPEGSFVRVMSSDGFLGVGQRRGGEIRPRKVVGGG